MCVCVCMCVDQLFSCEREARDAPKLAVNDRLQLENIGTRPFYCCLNLDISHLIVKGCLICADCIEFGTGDLWDTVGVPCGAFESILGPIQGRLGTPSDTSDGSLGYFSIIPENLPSTNHIFLCRWCTIRSLGLPWRAPYIHVARALPLLLHLMSYLLYRIAGIFANISIA